ncbi:hypothetical protein L2E82_06040 [Cichorium intybus]|uniref:Uncharacterized protein n=1 Tax=Cichorium intybus TaxID=13427 RepID=A0ACB9H903_CICIN|nr:hypothetical protein L2E82_06040 [Cichorium intybus]
MLLRFQATVTLPSPKSCSPFAFRMAMKEFTGAAHLSPHTSSSGGCKHRPTHPLNLRRFQVRNPPLFTFQRRPKGLATVINGDASLLSGHHGIDPTQPSSTSSGNWTSETLPILSLSPPE